MASTCKLFDEDAVYKINKKKIIDVGLVLENSEYLSSDEDQSDDPDYRDWGERMKKGYIRVAWHPNGAEEVIPEKKVKLCDRSLMPGDVVRKIVKGKETQLGYCRYTVVKADVQVVGTKKVIIGVDSKDLQPLEEFVADVAVFKDSWVGMVKTVKTELTLYCSDGSRCLMSDVDAFDMEDVLDKRERASEFKKYSFYPGQQLWGPTYCFQKVKWLFLNKSLKDIINVPNKTIRATVENVKVVALGVQWVCKAYSEENFRNQSTEQPKYHVTGDELRSIKMMNIFEPCTLQIGDRNYLLLQESYKVISLHEWKNRMSNRLNADANNSLLIKCKTSNMTEEKESNNEESSNEGTNNRSPDTSSVTSQSTASSIETVPNLTKKKGPHYPTKKKKLKSVRRQAMRHIMKKSLPLTLGDKLVTEALITETKAHVVWQDGTVEHNILSTSLFPVHHLDGHEFFPGDYVVDSKESQPYEYGVVKEVDHNGRTALVTWLKTYHSGGDPHPEVLSEKEVSVYDIKDHPDFKYRPGACVIRIVNAEVSESTSTAGQVVDVHPSGQVEVSWVNGNSSFCYPQELYRVGEYDSDDLWADDESISDEESWETESENSLSGVEDRVNEKVDIEEATRDLEKISIEFDDAKSKQEDMQEKLLVNIEKLRAGMARLEEVFTQNPTLQTCNVMRRLLELYKHCKVLDQLLGTAYFHERHLQSLVERLKHRGRVNSIQHMADQIFRLFSSTDAYNSDLSDLQLKQDMSCFNDLSKVDIDILIQSPTEKCKSLSSPVTFNLRSESPNLSIREPKSDLIKPLTSPVIPVFGAESLIQSTNKGSLNNKPLLSPVCPTSWTEPQSNLKGDEGLNRKPLLSPVSPTSGSEPRNLCQQLCAILKSRLLKAHQDAEIRFGMSRSETNALLAAEADQGQKKKEVQEMSPKKEPKNLSEKLPILNREGQNVKVDGQGIFSMLESVTDSHKYKLSIFQPLEPCAFFRIIKKEMNLLKTSLPEGIIVKSFEDRIDLYSILIKGPRRTPYEDGLFFFDFQLPADYPKVPPLCHYISYCSDRLNPNLYEGGKVCVSLLGTWGGKGTEMWNPETSNLLQVIVSIQGLILVSEPYYNEAGYERQKGTQMGMENSRMYNEMVVLKLVQSMTKLLICPPEVFQREIMIHFQTQSSKLIKRLECWLDMSESWNTAHPTSPITPTTFKEIHSPDMTSADSCKENDLPEFPLIPASKGFCLTLRKSLDEFKDVFSSNIFLS